MRPADSSRARHGSFALAVGLVALLAAAPRDAWSAPERKRLVVIGAGPGGLASAIAAKKEAIAHGHDLDVVVLESRGPTGTRKNMIAMARQTLNNLSWLGVDLRNEHNVQYLERRTVVNKGRRGPRLAPVRVRPELASGNVKDVLRQRNIATMPINGQEGELRRVARELGITVRYHTTVEDVRDTTDGVQLTTRPRKGGASDTIDGWMVVMAHGGDSVSDHDTGVAEEPSFVPRASGRPSLLAKIGVVSRTDATIGGRMLARVFNHTGGREIGNRFEPVPGVAGRKTHHVRLDGPVQGGDTVLLAELSGRETESHDQWTRRQARELGIETEPVGDPQEFFLALTSSRDAADPDRRVAMVPGARGGATGAKLLVGESLRKSTPLTGKAAQIALADGIDVGRTVVQLLEAAGDVSRERSILRRYERARVRATGALTRAALEEFHESGLTPRPRLVEGAAEKPTDARERAPGTARRRVTTARDRLRAARRAVRVGRGAGKSAR